jgi:hypothetical protein
MWTSMKKVFKQGCVDILAMFINNFLNQAINGIVNLLIPTIASITPAAAAAGQGLAAGVGAGLAKVSTSVAGVFTTIGTIITTLATAVATAIGTIATGIGTALVEIATAIATAAEVLAAAAEAIIVVGALALAIYAAFKIVGGVIDAIFGGGSSGDGDLKDLRAWAKMTHDLVKEIHDWLFINLQTILNSTFLPLVQVIYNNSIGCRDILEEIKELSAGINAHTQDTANILAGMHSFDSGTSYVPQTQIALIHKGEQIYNPANSGPAPAFAGAGGAVNVGPFYFGDIGSGVDVDSIARKIGEKVKNAIRAGRR